MEIIVHPTGRALTPDWSTNSFIVVVFEDFLSKARVKKLLIDNHCKTVHGPAGCSGAFSFLIQIYESIVSQRLSNTAKYVISTKISRKIQECKPLLATLRSFSPNVKCCLWNCVAQTWCNKTSHWNDVMVVWTLLSIVALTLREILSLKWSVFHCIQLFYHLCIHFHFLEPYT